MRTKKFLSVLLVVIVFTLAIATTIAGAADPGGRGVEKDITAGKTYDISSGACGLYFQNAPATGKLEIGRADKASFPFKFMKDVCTVNYEAKNGAKVHSFEGILISYVTLTKPQLDKWNAGELAFYVHDESWTTCDASLVAGGPHGRLACWTGAFDSFGLVDTYVKTDEEDAKKMAKEPSGDKVSAGQTLDFYSGICGVYVSGVPTSGYVDMDRVDRSDLGMKFIKDACEFTFVDAKEKDLSMGGALMIGYVNLNAAQEAAWEAGEIGFFVNYGSGWTELNAMKIDESGTPRVCATMSGPGTFGLVDLSEKPDEE